MNENSVIAAQGNQRKFQAKSQVAKNLEVARK